jgi:hypothetical protein
VIQTTRDYSLAKFKLHYYYDATTGTSTGKLYNDDGVTPDAFEKGRYEILNFTATPSVASTVITLTSETGANFNASVHEVSLIVHNLNSKPKKVTINGRKAKFRWNKNTKQLEIDVLWTEKTSKEITIQLAR